MEHKHTTDTLKTKREPLKERDGNTPALSQPKKPRLDSIIKIIITTDIIQSIALLIHMIDHLLN